MNYQERFEQYIVRELHPETAANIGRIVLESPLLSAEAAMGVILEMKLDHIRKDRDLELARIDENQYELFTQD